MSNFCFLAFCSVSMVYRPLIAHTYVLGISYACYSIIWLSSYELDSFNCIFRSFGVCVWVAVSCIGDIVFFESSVIAIKNTESIYFFLFFWNVQFFGAQILICVDRLTPRPKIFNISFIHELYSFCSLIVCNQESHPKVAATRCSMFSSVKCYFDEAKFRLYSIQLENTAKNGNSLGYVPMFHCVFFFLHPYGTFITIVSIRWSVRTMENQSSDSHRVSYKHWDQLTVLKQKSRRSSLWFVFFENISNNQPRQKDSWIIFPNRCKSHVQPNPR